MLRRVFVASSMFVLLALGAGCSGSSGPRADVAAACGTAGGFCLANCNLGCSDNGGCSVTDIAPNQPIELQFSQVLDPATVNTASVSIRTPSGQEPVGALIVEDNLVRFLPEVRTVQGSTFFGFTSNETYTITIPGGAAPNAVESTAGDRLDETFTCQVAITREVVDLNNTPPVATLVAPEEPPGGAPRDSVLVLEFDEFIDAGPFFGAVGSDSPIRFRVRRTRTNPMGERECDPLSAPFDLSGQPRLSNDLVRGVTRVEFAPFELLPPDVCLEAEVTNLVRDLSGRRATPGFFRVVLEAEDLDMRSETISFDSDELLDRDNSGGDWSGGEATFAQTGGDGRHGRFILNDGSPIGGGVFLFSTDSQVLSGNDQGNDLSFSAGTTLVTDGTFYFSEMVVPAGTTLRFSGANPLRIFVRGRCQIDGTIDCSGAEVPVFDTMNPAAGPLPGQSGSRGGPGAGAGGTGAFSGDNSGNAMQPAFNNFDGFPGEDAVANGAAGFGMATVGTAGQGGLLHPPTNNSNDNSLRAPGVPGSDWHGGVGSGGGFVTAGGIGTVPTARGNASGGQGAGSLPPDTPAGIALAGFTNGKPMGVRSDEFFMVAGSGGGGGGSGLFSQFIIQPIFIPNFYPGGGGSGGGGAFGLFVGDSLDLGMAAVVDVSGGNCVASVTEVVSDTGFPTAGGGGSGGSLLIQVTGATMFEGSLVALGGEGAPNGYDQPGPIDLIANGGNGSEGFVRIETAGRLLSLGDVGMIDPMPSAMSVAQLEEPNDLVGFNSTFVNTAALFAPVYDRYVIEATVDGVPMTFSDDPAFGMAATDGAALRFLVQGVDLDPLTGTPVLETDPVTGVVTPQQPAPWRNAVGVSVGGGGTLNGDGRRAFRFALIQDTRVATTVTIQSVTIQFRV